MTEHLIYILIIIFLGGFLAIVLYLMTGILKARKHKRSVLQLFDVSETDIVFLGDSITEQCPWSELFQKTNIKNRGIGGDTTKGVLSRVESIIEGKPSKIFLCIGTNDNMFRIRPRKTIENTQKIIQMIQEKSKNTKIYLESLLPVRGLVANLNTNGRIKKINNEIKNIAAELGIPFIYLYDQFLDEKGRLDKKYSLDGLHLNGDGYLKWKGFIKKYVNE
ncbi:MAG: GDSL-type esterase/lipase family protein [Candidatus Hodarchaeota archaeon]